MSDPTAGTRGFVAELVELVELVREGVARRVGRGGHE
jgi:hypothetical protein